LSSHDTPRFVNMVQEDQSALKLATLFQMTMPGAPMVYYGDEIGLTGGHDPGSRGAFPWDQARWDSELRDYVRAAIQVRKAHPALRRGTYRTLLADGELLAFERVYENKRLVVAFNTAARPMTLSVPLDSPAGQPQVVFGTAQAVAAESGLTIQADARTGTVIELA